MDYQATNSLKADSILVPVDFSPASRFALLYAARTASCSGGGLTVLHVVHEPGDAPGFYPRKEGHGQLVPIDEIAMGMLKDFMDKLRESHPTSQPLRDARLEVVQGLPATRIPEVARLRGADLIIIGCSPRSRLSRILKGSVTDDVAKRSEVPVMVIHSQDESPEIARLKRAVHEPAAVIPIRPADNSAAESLIRPT